MLESSFGIQRAFSTCFGGVVHHAMSSRCFPQQVTPSTDLIPKPTLTLYRSLDRRLLAPRPQAHVITASDEQSCDQDGPFCPRIPEKRLFTELP